MPLLTINIPCFNQAKNLPFIFYAYTKQGFKDFELLICDDGSSDNTKEVVKEWQKRADYPIRYFFQEDKGNRLAEAENLGLRNAEGKYLLNTNGDIIPMPFFKITLAGREFNWFSMLVNYVQNLREDAILVGVRHGLKSDFTERKLEDLDDFSIIRSNIVNFDYRSQILPEIDKFYPQYLLVSGNNFLAPTRAIKAVGGWDGEIIDYGWDDWILCCKLKRLGLKFKGLPQAIGLHIEHGRRESPIMEKSPGFKRLRYYEKKYGY